MKINTKHYAISLYQALKDSNSKETPKILENFVNLLAQKHILSKAGQIITDFKKYFNQQEGLIEVKVTSAENLSSQDQKIITDQLHRATTKKAEITNQVESDLIGGLKLEFNDLIIDGSLKNSLNNLKANLKS